MQGDDANDTRFKDMVKQYCIKRENSILKKTQKKLGKKHKKNSDSLSLMQAGIQDLPKTKATTGSAPGKKEDGKLDKSICSLPPNIQGIIPEGAGAEQEKVKKKGKKKKAVVTASQDIWTPPSPKANPYMEMIDAIFVNFLRREFLRMDP